MKKKAILLHIGLHKTGTTSIQGGLKDISEQLKTFGVSYLPIGFGYTTKEFLGHHNLSWQLLDDPRFRPDMGDWKLAIEHMHQSKHHQFIISSEAFGKFLSDDIVKLQTYLKGFNVSIIIFLRNQIELLQSIYLGVGDRFLLADPNTFVLSAMKKRAYNFYEIIKDWEKVFGTNKIIIKTFEEEKANLLNPFFECFGLDKQQFTTAKRPLNTSKSARFVALNRHLSSLSKKYIDSKTYNLELAPVFSKLADEMGWVRNGEDVVDQETADRIFNFFRAQNVQICQDFRALPSEYLERRIVRKCHSALTPDEILEFMLRACIQQRLIMHESRAYLLDKLKKPGRAKALRHKAQCLKGDSYDASLIRINDIPSIEF